MFTLSVFDQIPEQIPRRQFQSLVDKRGADKWVKSFTCWQQLVAMIFAQMPARTSLRDVVASFNGQPVRHALTRCSRTCSVCCWPMSRFLANNPNAVRLQIITALVAFVALKLLQQARRITFALKRIRSVVKSQLFNLRAIETWPDKAPKAVIADTPASASALKDEQNSRLISESLRLSPINTVAITRPIAKSP